MHRNIYLVFPRKILVMINKFLSPVAIASFANFVPEIVELLGNRPKYAGTYEVGQLVNIYSYLPYCVPDLLPTSLFQYQRFLNLEQTFT